MDILRTFLQEQRICDWHFPITVGAAGKRYANITETLKALVLQARIQTGEVRVQSLHTTCSLLLQEDEAGLLTHDLMRCLDQIIPPSAHDDEKRRLTGEGEYYRHDDMNVRTENLAEGEERVNGHAHLRAMLVGQPMLTLSVAKGELVLGKWQQVLFFDFDDQGDPPAKERTIYVRAHSI